jgi:hypothetical protein
MKPEAKTDLLFCIILALCIVGFVMGAANI